MIYELPTSIHIDDEEYQIRNKGDYRVILDCIIALNDIDLSEENRLQCCLFIFYENLSEIENITAAIKEMFKFINYGDEEEENAPKPKLMDWEQDFKHIVSPINKILGQEIRTIPYLHWWSFLSGYMEIGECVFSTIVSIRNKKARGKKLDKWEQDFYVDNIKMVKIEEKLTEEERAWLSDEF